ncbi:hypothetical protein SPM24T3_23137 [Serratia sp. M24T3]|nr:hypothetical protein SPM24T3_23137 [Serratia sp. M24T3]
MNSLNTGQNRLCPSERFESRHQFYPAFDIPVALLNQVVQILVLPDRDSFLFFLTGIGRSQRRCIGATLIDSHHFGLAMMSDGLAEETQGSGGIPLSCQQKIDGLPCGINCPVQIFPLASDFDVGFIHSPPATRATFMPAEGFIQQRYQADNPAVSVEWSTTTPRSAIISSRFRRLRE